MYSALDEDYLRYLLKWTELGFSLVSCMLDLTKLFFDVLYTGLNYSSVWLAWIKVPLDSYPERTALVWVSCILV